MLNSGLIAAGVGLIKFSEGSVQTSIFLLLFFILLIAITVAGLATIRLAKGYYREAVYTKTVVERELGLLETLPDLPEGRANLSIAVTDGQRDYHRVLRGDQIGDRDKAEETPLQKVMGLAQSITATTEGMFWLMIGIQGIGAAIAVFNMVSAGAG